MITESPSNHDHLETWTVRQLLEGINAEDRRVPEAVAEAIPALEALVEQLVPRMQQGGRLFYIGAGTSGRLGIVDASECPPTYGVPHGMVVGIIAGGDGAIRKAVEFAEDDPAQAWIDLQEHRIEPLDTVVGIAASGRTPYVVGGLDQARAAGCLTGCIVCNPDSAVAAAAEYPVVAVVGPEFVTGSTRMKSGTAQKLLLNMLTTTVMIRLGRVKGSRMIDMQLSNHKLVERGTRMVAEGTGLNDSEARALLLEHGSVRRAIDQWKHSNPPRA